MTPRKQIEVGTRFGHLVVVAASDPVDCGHGHIRSASIVMCDCGIRKVVANTELTRGRVQSCGCMKGNVIHGQSKSKLYCIWSSMVSRCNSGKSKDCRDYHDRGICVCEEWKSFPSFSSWANANGYIDGLSIDRIDPNGNYEPSNCRWITMREQANNKRNTIYLTLNGERKTLIEWSRSFGISPKLVRQRLSKGWSAERALSR